VLSVIAAILDQIARRFNLPCGFTDS
jgi:hypothetical protein